MKIFTIIVTNNNEKTIVPCIKSVLCQSPRPKIIIIDNNSQDQTLNMVKKINSADIKLISNQTNLGYADGNNLGIEEARQLDPDYFLIVNPDAILQKDSLHYLVESAQTIPGIFGPEIFSVTSLKTYWSRGGVLDKKRWTAGMIDFQKKVTSLRVNLSKIKAVDFISGTCMLIPSALIRQDLRFYSPYFMYYEDTEFCVRAERLGYPSFVVPKARLLHLEQSRLGNFPDLKKYYLARNHLLFVERNAPLRVKLRELLRLPKTLVDHSKNQDNFSTRGIKDYFLRKFGQTN